MDYEFLIGARQLTPFRKIDRTLACFRLLPGTKTYENSQHEPLTFARFSNYLTLVDESERRKILEEKQAFFGQSAS
jgi:hypothetical protein